MDDEPIDGEVMPDQASDTLRSNVSRRPSRSKLERGHIKQTLIDELAAQNKTQTRLAEENGVVPSSISEFATRHRHEIEARRADMGNVFFGLWVIDKARRLAEYQQDIEDIDAVLEQMGLPAPDLIRVKQLLLKNVADEMGQLPAKVAVQVNTENDYRYEVVGVEIEEMK